MSIPPSKDIPPARRQATDISLEEINNLRFVAPKKKSKALPLTISLLLLASISGIGYWQKDWIQPRLNGVKGIISEASANLLKDSEETSEQASSETANRSNAVSEAGQTGSAQAAERASEASTAPTTATSTTATDSVLSPNPVATGDAPDQLLNHRRYDIRDPDTLVALNANSTLLLAPDAQKAVNEMLAKAKAEGVQLGVISGFRSLEDQNYLYFDLKAERGQSAQARAEVSAPPGYSEHHTGYAVDFIDESKSNTHLEESFETTPAFAWLKKNAAFFNFEMSFPKGNEANVGYEPWHWRYVGNQESLELFYK